MLNVVTRHFCETQTYATFCPQIKEKNRSTVFKGVASISFFAV